MTDIKLPKGTKDLFPKEIEKWHFLEDKIKEFYSRFMYQEVRTPIFEHSELFSRGIGSETEVVSKEMYTFEDKAKRSLTLRPENTASLVRAAIEHNFIEEIYPLRFYYIGPMFRYDKPQKGRYRQFHQFGVEILADDSAQADAELIFSANKFLDEIGIKGLKLLINSVGCKKCRPAYLKALRKVAKKAELCNDCKGKAEKNPLRIFDCKQQNCKKSTEKFPRMLDSLCEECTTHFDLVKETLDGFGIKYTIDTTLVRGLDYYTKTAFEIVSEELGAQDALLGGGRYDGLFKELGGPDIAAVGFAAGMERIILNLSDYHKPKIKKTIIIYQQPQFIKEAIKIAQKFWENGYGAFVEYSQKKMKKQFQRANKLGADFAVILGEDEVKNNHLTIKDMKSREQKTIQTRDLQKWQKEYL